MRHQAPSTTPSQNIEDRVDNFADINRARTTTGFGSRDQWFEDVPLLLRTVD